jgi:lipoprotein-anchoring transpeptidase ErfK/SrfK
MMSFATRWKKYKTPLLATAGISLFVLGGGDYFVQAHSKGTAHQPTTVSASQTVVKTTSAASSKSAPTTTSVKAEPASWNSTRKLHAADLLPPNTPVGPKFDWTSPTGGPYPNLKRYHNIWIDASLSTQRIHIMSGNKVIYTMITSSGLDGPDTYTPTGTYYVQNRGTWFYAPRFKEGAEYWVSWKGWGDYLFHTVPMDIHRHVIAADAAKLGVKDSHGCFHLTISDAKWIYENIPKGTKVVIHK